MSYILQYLLQYFNYIELIILMYFYLSRVFHAGVLLVIEYFYIAVLVLLLR